MTWPPGKEILIDTNVFKHLCDKDANFNHDGNVDNLLSALMGIRCRLIVDSIGLFMEEFDRIVKPQFEREDEIAQEVYVLRYWRLIDNHEERETGTNRELTKLIKKVIIENERIDIAFVYLAIAQGRVLVSNDRDHIVLGPASKQPKNGDRRTRLKKLAKRHMQKGCDILFSSEANKLLEAENA